MRGHFWRGKAWLWPVLWALLLLTGTSWPGPDLPRVPFNVPDKVIHCGLYLVLSILVVNALIRRGSRPRSWRFVAGVILAGMIFAALDELHQKFIPGRDCDPLDWLADSVGLVTGSIGTYMYLIKRRVEVFHG